MESPYVEFSLKSGEGSTSTHIVASRASGSVAAEPLDAGKYSYLWTGHTDSGDLPSVAETGHYALALSSLTEVKARAELEFQRLLGLQKGESAEMGIDRQSGVQEEASSTGTESLAKKPRCEGGKEGER